MDRARGLYEELITEAVAAELDQLGQRLVVDREPLRAADTADRIALHVGRLIRRALTGVGDRDRAVLGISLARRLLEQIEALIPDSGVAQDKPVEARPVLRALHARLPDGRPETIAAPLIPLLDTTLLTNSPGEPRVGSQILAEVESADGLDVVMAFIRRSGIAPMLEALGRHRHAGRQLRILTTVYTGSTEARALDDLCALGADVRVSYDTTSTRLHAKAWLFHRQSGFSTAYIGSSNLTHSAQVNGLEWNVRISGARNPDVIEKVSAVFESYWSSDDFVPYEPAEFEREARRKPAGPTVVLSPIELRLEPFQERLLEQVAVSRERGHHRNLLVAATGTGKTVMAAVDYARLRPKLPRARMLFVAHREEILDQSLATFRHCLRDACFGERWVARDRPSRFEHVFASIQSLNAAGLDDLAPDHFDVVIVDEFHHAAARSYRRLLEHVRPRELLGLTATPERSDGLPILSWFDGRIAAELRLWDAIDQHRLAPFVYYGIHDGQNLQAVPWRRGRGYDVDELSKLLTADDAWARLVLDQVRKRVDDPAQMKAIGFCVSVDHARFMARVFRRHGVHATAIWGDSPEDERRSALADLSAGTVNVVFSVDLFNEGIDVPLVDTLLLLRPTDSPTLFLQQLGRGLRKARGKSFCTVLDFIGRHHVEFRFDRRLRALFGGSRRELEDQIEHKFPFLPAGCHLELDRVAEEIVLASVRSAIPAHWTAKVEELRRAIKAGRRPTLGQFLDDSGLELGDVYTGQKSWSDLCADAGAELRPPGPHEQTLRRACGRLLHVDDAERIATYRRILACDTPPDLDGSSARDRRSVRMLIGSLTDQAVDKTTPLDDGCRLAWQHPQVRAEALELLDVLESRVDHVHAPLGSHPEVPLEVHARYTRVEILAAFGVGSSAKVQPWQTGVLWEENAKADLLAFTLDKTRGGFSPTTRYRDYAISRELIHWESQGATRADGETGRRYQRHVSLGTSILLFARLHTDDRAFWFLGPATYVRHESERPMAIIWKLARPLPGDLFAQFAAAVA